MAIYYSLEATETTANPQQDISSLAFDDNFAMKLIQRDPGLLSGNPVQERQASINR